MKGRPQFGFALAAFLAVALALAYCFNLRP